MEYHLPNGQPCGPRSPTAHNGDGAVSSSAPPGGTHEPDDLADEDTVVHVVTARRVTARQRQVDIGKARPEYLRYLACVPKEQRTASRPQTPEPTAQVSKRTFDRMLSEWRRLLHEYDVLPIEAHTSSSSSGPSQSQPPVPSRLAIHREMEPQQEAWGGYSLDNQDSYQASISSTAGAVAGNAELNGFGIMKETMPLPNLHQGLYRGAITKHHYSDGPPAAPSLHRRYPTASSPDLEERGSRLRASCRAVATATSPGSWHHPDPSEPMKVYENRDFGSSEPMQVTPSFSGSTSELRSSLQ
jgi:hypothetical protein